MKMKKVVALAAAGTLIVAGISGCAKNAGPDSSGKGDKKTEAAAPEEQEVGAVKVNHRPDECGLQEQAGPQADLGPFTVALHYFQPAVMVMGPNSSMKMEDYDKSQMHFELDTKATEYATNWGYAVDETPANLHVMYKLADKDGNVISEGMMMEMNAIDGSHYGTNLPKDSIKGPGEYQLTVTLYPPVDYGLHQDYITGAPARGWFKPLTAKMTWKVTQKNLDIVKENTVADPMAVPEKCKKYPVKLYEDKAAENNMKKAEEQPALPMTGDAMGMKH